MANKPNFEAVYYFDACVLIDLIEHSEDQEPSKTIAAILEDAQNGRFRAVTSIITIAEVLLAKSEKNQKKLDADVQARINKLWHPTSPIQLVEVHELIARDAQKLYREYYEKQEWSKTKGIDLVHLVTAKREGVTHFLSMREKAMKKWGLVLGFEVCEPIYNRPIEKIEDEILFPDNETGSG